jgi:hypothetical protein
LPESGSCMDWNTVAGYPNLLAVGVSNGDIFICAYESNNGSQTKTYVEPEAHAMGVLCVTWNANVPGLLASGAPNISYVFKNFHYSNTDKIHD